MSSGLASATGMFCFLVCCGRRGERGALSGGGGGGGGGATGARDCRRQNQLTPLPLQRRLSCVSQAGLVKVAPAPAASIDLPCCCLGIGGEGEGEEVGRG
jgi:hypothetical protein